MLLSALYTLALVQLFKIESNRCLFGRRGGFFCERKIRQLCERRSEQCQRARWRKNARRTARVFPEIE